MSFCDECGSRIDGTPVFCKVCGAKLDWPAEDGTAPELSAGDSPRFCAECGGKIEGTPLFCKSCGAKLSTPGSAGRGPIWRRVPRRRLVWSVAGLAVVVALVVGLSVGLTSGREGSLEASTSLMGATFETGDLEVYVPAYAEGAQPQISARRVTGTTPPPPSGSVSVGDAYDIEATSSLEEPVLVTFSYDPEDLPPGVDESNLYIATLSGDTWEPVPGGLIDTGDHTVSVSVEHFSWYQSLCSAAERFYDIYETVAGDKNRMEDFDDLPAPVRDDVYNNRGLLRNEILAAQWAQLSPLTVVAGKTLSYANIVSRLTDRALWLKDALENSAETVGLSIAAAVADQATGSEVGTIALDIYGSVGLAREIHKEFPDLKKLKDILDTPELALKIAAWTLSHEMAYINANVDEALASLSGRASLGDGVETYWIYYRSGLDDWHPDTEECGVLVYYKDADTGEWLLHYDGSASVKVAYVKDGTTLAENESSTIGFPTSSSVPEAFSTTSQSTSASISPTSTTSTTISTAADGKGEVRNKVIQGTWSWDIDADVDGTGTNTDLWWEHVDQEERYLVPQNGAEFAVIIGASFDSIDLELLRTLNYEAVALSGSDWAPFIDVGLVMAVRTTEGNYVKMEVTGFEPRSGVDRYDLKLRYVLYD